MKASRINPGRGDYCGQNRGFERVTAFYEKVKNVKADLAAVLV